MIKQYFSLEELRNAQDSKKIDLSSKGRDIQHMDLMYRDLVPTPEVLLYEDSMIERLALYGFGGPILLEESFLKHSTFIKSKEVTIPKVEYDYLVLSEEEEQKLSLLYVLEFLPTKEFYVHESAKMKVALFTDAELFTSNSIQKMDMILYNVEGLGVLCYYKDKPKSFSLDFDIESVGKRLLLLDAALAAYEDRHMSEKGYEFCGLVANILHNSGVEVLPTKERSSIVVGMDILQFDKIYKAGYLEVERTIKNKDNFYIVISLKNYMRKGFGPHEAPAFASALFLLLKSQSPHIETIKAVIDSIETDSMYY